MGAVFLWEDDTPSNESDEISLLGMVLYAGFLRVSITLLG